MKSSTDRAMLLVLVLIQSVWTLAQDEPKHEVTQEIQAVIRREEWPGWGGGEPLPAELKSALVPEVFERYQTEPGEKSKFTGKVTGIDSFAQVEVGIVSLIGVQWLKNENYNWTKVSSDGSFDAIVNKQADARKTLVVRAPHHAWTFLRAEFEPTESARNIELRVKPSKPIRLTVEDADGNPVSGYRVEVFIPYKSFDDAGKELRAQRLDTFVAKGPDLALDLALEPTGFLISGGKNIAPYYQVVDPRKADHFHFRMLAESRVTGVITRNGQPVPDQSLLIVNEAAPLSASRRKTDKQGRFDIPGRVPGHHDIYIDNKTAATVDVAEGETKDITIDLSAVPDNTKP